MSIKVHREIILAHFNELQNEYPGVVIRNNSDGLFIVAGIISFDAEYKEKTISGDFYIEISVPEHYPDMTTPPTVKEIGGVIKDKFHVNSDDGSLCLGAHLEVRRIFSRNPTLLGFTENLLIPFLFSFMVWRDTGTTPYGELSHGVQGIVEYYENLFEAKGLIAVLGLLRILGDDHYRGHMICPCGSQKILRKCHGEQILEIKCLQPPQDFLSEYYQALTFSLKDIKLNPPRSCISRSLVSHYDNRKRPTV